MNIGLVILAVYIAVLLGIALYASKKDKKNIKDFATGGGLGIFILTLTFSATYHSAYAFMGAGGFAYKNGIGWWCNGLWTVLPGVLFWVWGRRFWYLGKRYGYLSVSDYASDVYQSKTVGIFVTLITMIFTIPYVAIQAIGCSYIFQTISGGMLSYTVGGIYVRRPTRRLALGYPCKFPIRCRCLPSSVLSYAGTLHNAGAKRRRNRSGLGFSLDRHYIRHDDVPAGHLALFRRKKS